MADEPFSTRAMLRQAFMASEAWTPSESPCVRPRLAGWQSTRVLAASEMASPTASGSMPSASAAATVSAARSAPCS
jgi:hypothetical protein